MMICDLCSTPGKGIIVGPEQMRRAVFVKGFDPFALGLSRETGIYRQHGAGAYEYWKTNVIAPDMTNWNICSRCMTHLKNYLDEPPQADGFAGLQFADPSATPAIRKEVEKRYQPQPVRQELVAEVGESTPDRKKLLSMQGSMVLIGLALGWMPCIGFLAGAVAAMVWLRWEHTPPANMVKKGSLAGLLAGIGGFLITMLFMLVSWAVNPEATVLGSILGTFGSGVFTTLLSTGTGALAGLLMRKQRRKVTMPATSVTGNVLKKREGRDVEGVTGISTEGDKGIQPTKTRGKLCPWCGEDNPEYNRSIFAQEFCIACGGSMARVEARAVQELETAWEVVKLRQILRRSGGGSIFWGIVAVFVGFALLQESGLNFLLVPIGLFLIGTGIATRRSPGPSTLQVDAFAMLLVGGWNIIILLTGNYFGVIGIFQIIGAIQRFAQQSKFNQMHYVSESRIIQVETLVARAQKANNTADNLIQFQAKGKNWKARLAPEVVTLVAGNAQQIRFVSDSQFALTTETEVTSGKQAKVSIQVGSDTWPGEIFPESLERYEVWKTEPKVRLPEVNHKHPVSSSLEPFKEAQEQEPATEIPQPIPESKSLQEADTLPPVQETLTSSPETETPSPLSPEIEAKPAETPVTDSGKTSQQIPAVMQSGTGKASLPVTLSAIAPLVVKDIPQPKAAVSVPSPGEQPESLVTSLQAEQKGQSLPGILRWPPAVVLLNLTGLGLGYLYLNRWRRWLAHFLLTVGLLVVAFLVNTARAPLLWVIVFGLWLLWMSIDGWRQARRLAQAQAEVTKTIGRPWLPIALAILLILLSIAGFGFYTVLGQQEFKAGLVAYGLADCRTAQPYFNRVTTWFRLTFDPNLIAAEAKNTECNLLVKAEDSRRQYKQEEAITAYETYLDTYPNTALALPAKTAVAETYVEWAAHLRADHNYSLALEKYGVVLEKYADTPSSQQVGNLVAETYLALGHDTGKDGQALIKQTWRQVKDGTFATSPAIGKIVNEPGRFWYEGNQFTLPDQLRAIKPGHFRYAVYVEETKKEIERCPYIPGGTIVRLQFIWQVTVRDTLMAKVVADKTFEGTNPPTCPFSQRFSSFGEIKYKEGNPPSTATVANWLANRGWE